MLEDNILTLAMMVFADKQPGEADVQCIHRNPFAAGDVYEDPATVRRLRSRLDPRSAYCASKPTGISPEKKWAPAS